MYFETPSMGFAVQMHLENCASLTFDLSALEMGTTLNTPDGKYFWTHKPK